MNETEINQFLNEYDIDFETLENGVYQLAYTCSDSNVLVARGNDLEACCSALYQRILLYEMPLHLKLLEWYFALLPIIFLATFGAYFISNALELGGTAPLRFLAQLHLGIWLADAFWPPAVIRMRLTRTSRTFFYRVLAVLVWLVIVADAATLLRQLLPA